ncbi:tyrosine-type recombinase/integrase [Pollutibacter soli]|uniref:tyrosine-type recombinase/integrase n=1 Tax=Pollutibacter soli TaxID=3034157 RepID=UPI003013CD17
MLLPEIPEVQRFINYIRFEKRYSAHTITAYQDDLSDFFSFTSRVFESDSPNSVSTLMIRSWMAEMTEAGIIPRSINRKISCLKSFFKFCRTHSIRDDNPASAIRLLKTRKRLPSFVEEHQMDTLFTHVEFPDEYNGRVEKLMLRLLYQCGIRVGELVSIRQQQIDSYQKVIRILGKGNKERMIPVNPDLLNEISAYCKEKKSLGFSDDYLLIKDNGKQYTSRNVYDVVKKWLSLVTTAEKKSPHVLRHSFATHLMNNGADLNAVKDLLGHSSLAATQVYTHNSIEKLRDIHRKAHPKG